MTTDNDPTAHAEIEAIRAACRHLDTFQLDDCVLYTSCEPCPMCLGAVYWARIPEIVYGCAREDAKPFGFDDEFFYREVCRCPEERTINMQQALREEALDPFRLWSESTGKIPY